MQSRMCDAANASNELADLRAFERRFTEVVADYKPVALRYQILLTIISLIAVVGAWCWIRDPRTSMVAFLQSLYLHPVFTLAILILIVAFLFGIHKIVIAPNIITARMRDVLYDFNMSCDDTGKLILKPRPHYH